jgi:DNA polymerase III psi subunit
MVFAVTSSKIVQLACNLASQSWYLKEDTEKHHFTKVTPVLDEIRDYTNSNWISKWNIQDTSMVLDVTSSKIVQFACNLASQSW